MHTNGITKRLVLLGLAALGVYAVVGTSSSPAGTSGPPTPQVVVANTTANPVPVVQQGGVTVNGTPNVTVANTTANPVPVVQQGAVAISGTPSVNVANSATSPVLVRSVDGGTVQPVELVNNTIFQDASTTGSSGVLYTVPAGKRLVVEYVSWSIVIHSGEHPFLTQLSWTPPSSGSAALYVPLQFTGTDAYGDHFTGGGLVKAYVEAGLDVEYEVLRDNNTGTMNANVTVSGYLVNVP